MPCPQGLPISFLHVLKNYYFLYDLKDWVWERFDAPGQDLQGLRRLRRMREKMPLPAGYAGHLQRNLGKNAGGQSAAPGT